MGKWLRPALCPLRDGLALVLPKPLVRVFCSPAAFAFIVHPRDLYDVERRYPAFRQLPPQMRELVLRYHKQMSCRAAHADLPGLDTPRYTVKS